MYCKLGGSKILLLVAAFLSTAGLVPAQSTFDSQPPASVTILDSTKDLDGLQGSVRRVKTESARLEIKEGRLFEGPRQLVEVTTYALTGNRIENVSYPVSNSPVGREEYKYDEKGHIIEMTLRGDGGAILSREAYDYEFDRFGNWTKMVTNLVVFEDGQLKREPVEVTYRSLTYYFDENIASAVAAPASQKPSQPAPASLGIRTTDRSGFAGGSNQISDRAASSMPVDTRSAEPIPNTREEKSAPTATSEKLASINSPALKEAGASSSVGPKAAPEEKKLEPRPVHLSETTPVPKSTAAEKQPESLAVPTRVNPGAARPAADDKRLESRSKENLNVAKSAPEEKLEPRPIPVKENSIIPKSVPEEQKLEPKPISVKETTDDKPSTAANRNTPTPVSPVPASLGANSGTKSPPAENLSPLMRAMAYYKKGSELFEVGDIKGSVAVYLQAIELEPKSAEFRLALGHAYLKLQQDKDAAKALKESVRLNPEVAEAQYGLGLANFRMGRHKEAADAFKKATLLQPNMSKAHFGLGLAYQELGKGDGLVEQYRILQRLDSNLAKQLAQAFPDYNLPCKVPPFCK